MLTNELSDLSTSYPLNTDYLEVLNAQLPIEWVNDALSMTTHATIRRRKIQPQDVLRLVIGMSLLRQEPINTVAEQLALSSSQLDHALLSAKSSLTAARQRLGVEPVQWLFQQSANSWAQNIESEKWQKLRVYAIDGTNFRTEDTPECREHFGSANTSSEYQSGYPVMQMTCLMDTSSHLIIKAALGPYREAEITQASQLLDDVSDDSVLLMDKLYHSAELLHHHENQGVNRHWVTPLKKDIKFKILEKYSENDWLVERELSSHARNRSPSLPKKWSFRVISYQLDGYNKRIIATSLPKALYNAEDIVELYHQRWEIELGYREMKSSLLRKSITLRSKTVELVYQEVYGMLLAYNLIRYEIALAAKEAKVSPLRISFKLGFKVVLYDYTAICQTKSAQSIPARLKDLTESLREFIMPKPSRPNYERSVKIRPSKFPLKSTRQKKKLP